MRVTSPLEAHKKSLTNEIKAHLSDKSAISRNVAALLARHYGWVILALGMVIISLETVEHLMSGEGGGVFFYGELILVVVLLSLTGYLVRMLLVSLDERAQAIQTLGLKHELSMYLSSGLDISEVSRRLIQRITSIIPLEGVHLYLYDGNKSWFTRVDPDPEGETNGKKKDDLLFGIDPYPCRQCLVQRKSALRTIHSCNQVECLLYIQTKHGYCLPLTHGSQPVGLLHLYASSHKDLTPTQIELLENVSTEMSSALHVSIEKKAREEELLSQKIRSVQLDIARDLHDTLGQNIAYLRMKLDVLSEKKMQSRADTLAEIQQMSDVANESYDLVRGTLAVLQSGGMADLNGLLSRYARQVEERAAFTVEFNSQGKQKQLSPNQIRQLFFIFREALSNIEKHSSASQICVEMTWGSEDLALIISDNGCGFEQNHNYYENHYGLKFMRDRTEQMNGSFSILSSIGMGTNIIVHVPYD